MKTIIKNSKFWNEQYNNLQVLTEEARQLLADNWLTTTNLVDAELKACVGFNTEEPDYGSYRNSWEAKEARSTYTPIIESIITIEEYNQLPQVIEEREKEENKKNEKSKLLNAILEQAPVILEERQKIADAEALENNSKKIIPINGRKYKFELFWEKYETIEQVKEVITKKSKNVWFDKKNQLENAIQDAIQWRTGYLPIYYTELWIQF